MLLDAESNLEDEIVVLRRLEKSARETLTTPKRQLPILAIQDTRLSKLGSPMVGASFDVSIKILRKSSKAC